LLKAIIKTTGGMASRRRYLVDRESLDQVAVEWSRIKPWYPLARRYFGATYTRINAYRRKAPGCSHGVTASLRRLEK
jgi:hypothetical protein